MHISVSNGIIYRLRLKCVFKDKVHTIYKERKIVAYSGDIM